MSKQTKVYIFVRGEGFYTLELKNDIEAKANADINPGTIRVEDTNGKIVWQASKAFC